VPPESIVYVDECDIEQCLLMRREQKSVAKISGKKYKRTNIVAGICQGEWLAPMEYTGTTDSILFEFWFEQNRFGKVYTAKSANHYRQWHTNNPMNGVANIRIF